MNTTKILFNNISHFTTIKGYKCILQVMGLTNGVFWMAWFIDSFIIMTFSSAVLTFILTVIVVPSRKLNNWLTIYNNSYRIYDLIRQINSWNVSIYCSMETCSFLRTLRLYLCSWCHTRYLLPSYHSSSRPCSGTNITISMVPKALMLLIN